MSRSKHATVRGHVAKSEYSKSGCSKVGAVGRRKQNGHSYVCPCCVSNRSFDDFKVASRRVLRRTYKVPNDE